MADVVIKVGGSLLDWPELPGRLGVFLKELGERKVVLIAGGGAVVDVVRAMDRTHGLGEERSHWLAIRGMDLTAALLASILPGSRLVERLEELRPVWERCEVPVLSTRGLLERMDAPGADPLPASWDVTSDSIAARRVSSGCPSAHPAQERKLAGIGHLARGRPARAGRSDVP